VKFRETDQALIPNEHEDPFDLALRAAATNIGATPAIERLADELGQNRSELDLKRGSPGSSLTKIEPGLNLHTELRSAKSGCRHRAFALIGSYAAFVLAMWVPFGPFNGMSYETGFALQSETSPLLNGFLFGDPLRVHTNFFYHLAYLFSKVIGLHGSWLAY
jgi:hypothetical protein